MKNITYTAIMQFRILKILNNLHENYDFCFYKNQSITIKKYLNMLIEDNFDYNARVQAWKIEKALLKDIRNKNVVFKNAKTYLNQYADEYMSKIYKNEIEEERKQALQM